MPKQASPREDGRGSSSVEFSLGGVFPSRNITVAGCLIRNNLSSHHQPGFTNTRLASLSHYFNPKLN
jgi:hypothetical protein